MKRIVKYISLDPYYSDVIQTYIGSSSEEIDNIQYETEEAMQGDNFTRIYKPQVIKFEIDEHLLA